MSESKNGTEKDEEEKLSFNPTTSGSTGRRERSPSAMSQCSSGVLEWDPSADVGNGATAATVSGIDGQGTFQQSGISSFRGLQDIASVSVLYGPTYDATGRRIPFQQVPYGGAQQQSNPLQAYSTPSASPKPLPTLEYSPVAAEDNNSSQDPSRQRIVKEILQGRAGDLEQREDNKENSCTAASVIAQHSSGSSNNNNDELTDDRRTPSGRVVSEASTDWEYGNEKKISRSRSRLFIPDWQTQGVTRSEIEYRKRKESGSSTSAASSIFLLQVEAQMKNQCQATSSSSSVNDSKKSDTKSKEHPFKSTSSSDLELRKLHNIMTKRHPTTSAEEHRHRQEFGAERSGESDPSSMCMAVNRFLNIVEEDSTKQGVKYDILKTHRDYHMMKVVKQLAKLEKLNRALISYKRSRSGKTSKTNDERAEKAVHTDSSAAVAVTSTSQKDSSQSEHGQRKRNVEEIKSQDHKDLCESDDGNNRKRKDKQIELQKEAAKSESSTKEPATAARRSSIGFFVPLIPMENNDFIEEKLPDSEVFNIKGPKTIQDCLKEHNPKCYQSIKERDDFLVTIRRERQVHNETLLRHALESNMDAEDIDDYLKRNYRYGNADERRRLKAFWEMYIEAQRQKGNKENVDNGKKSHVISSKEMKERTQKLRMNDPVILEKQRKEADERKRKANVALKKHFSTNLRMYQKLGGVNIPDRLKLGPRPS